VITEVLVNPRTSSTVRTEYTLGEWFELYNTRDDPVTLNNCRLRFGNPASSSRQFIFGNTAVIPALGFLIVTRSSDFGDVPNPNTGWGTEQLSNTADRITLLNPSGSAPAVTLDSVLWNFVAAPLAVQSYALRNVTLDNSDLRSTNWCTSTTTDGNRGNQGTPGAANNCPP
jgi:hypothetical protein